MSFSNLIGRNSKLRRQRREAGRISARRPRNPITAIGRAAASAIETLESRRLLAAPEVTLVGDATVDEGAAYSLNLSQIPAGLLFAVVDWGEGIDADGDGFPDVEAYTAAELAGGLTHTYLDGDNPYTITIDLVIDNPDAGEPDVFDNIATHAVAVLNVAPTISLSGAASVDEGSTYQLALGEIFDPSDYDTVTQAIVNWGDGTTQTVAAGDFDDVLSHVYADGPATRTISVSLVDEDGTHTAAGTLDVTVNNVAPTVDAGADQTGVEGSPVTLGGAFTDPGIGETHTSSWTISGPGGFSTSGSGSSVTFTPTDDGVYTATFTVSDGHASVSDTATVTVANAAPTVTVSGPATATAGSPVTYTASISDPGSADTHTVAWTVTNAGGAVVATGTGPSFTFTPAGGGNYAVSAVATDDDGAVSPAAATSLVVASSALNFVGTDGHDMFLVGPSATGGINVWYVALSGSFSLVLLGNFPTPSGITIDARGGNDVIAVDAAVTVPVQLSGGAGNDLLIGGAGDDLILGGAGNDVLVGRAGRDTLIGGDGTDFLLGSASEDVFFAGNAPPSTSEDKFLAPDDELNDVLLSDLSKDDDVLTA